MTARGSRPRVLVAAGIAVFLSGCWTPPSASVRPGGKPRVIADGIVVETVVDSARIEEILTVYVAPPGGSGNAGAGLQRRTADARVLSVDPSYRVLTLRYPNGRTEALKIGLHTPMKHIEPGDSVAIRRLQVSEQHVRRH